MKRKSAEKFDPVEFGERFNQFLRQCLETMPNSMFAEKFLDLETVELLGQERAMELADDIRRHWINNPASSYK